MRRRPSDEALRAAAERFAWELRGLSIVFSSARHRRIQALCWPVIEPDARAGRLEGRLACCNYGPRGRRPWAFYAYTRPDLAHLADASEEERLSGLLAAGELTPAELREVRDERG